jgi:hypothetical protein
MECTKELLEFYMYARYKSPDDATLNHKEDDLCRFHTSEDVFLLGPARKTAKAKANTLTTELGKKRKVDQKTTADTWTKSKPRREMAGWRDYISHEIDVSKKLDANFIFPKIHLIPHWVKQNGRYKTLQLDSAERY